jgi:crooked neck
VWISYIQFEIEINEKGRGRELYNVADKYFRDNPDLKEERVMLLENWREFELKNNDPHYLDIVNAKMPKRVKKQRRVKIVEGDQEEEAGYEEYYDYIFADDANQMKNLKILQKALSWK